MPSIFTNSSAATRNTRRPRSESENRRSGGHRLDSGSRRPKDVSSRSTDRRSPPSKNPSPPATLYSRPNVTQEQHPVSPASRSESPVSPRTPDVRASQSFMGTGNLFQYQLETPAALQQYLDTEDEDTTPQPPKKERLAPPPRVPAVHESSARLESQTRSAPVLEALVQPEASLKYPAVPESASRIEHAPRSLISPEPLSGFQPARMPLMGPEPPARLELPARLEAPAKPAQHMTPEPTAAPEPVAKIDPPERSEPAYMPPVPPQEPPPRLELQSRPLTPEETDPKDDQATVHGSPRHMSMSMPQLPSGLQPDSSPVMARAFTPPIAPMREPDPSQIMQPLPVYPYPIQDPRAYYAPQMHDGGQANPYMYPTHYEMPHHRQPMPFYHQSPDPYRRNRLSMVSIGNESLYSHDPGDYGAEDSHESTATGRSTPQDGASDLLSRISNALPDLQLLLSRCEEVTGHHSKESKLITSGQGEDGPQYHEQHQHQEALKHKDLRIEELERELVQKSETYATERQKMRFEIGNLQEQYKDLQDELVSRARSRKKSTSTIDVDYKARAQVLALDNEKLREELQELKDGRGALEEAKAAAERALASLEDKVRLLDSELDITKRAESSLTSKINDAVAAAAVVAHGQGDRRELIEQHQAAKDRHSNLEEALRARDGRFDEARKAWIRELEEVRKSAARELDEARKLGARDADEARKTWTREKEELAKAHEDDKGRLRADADKEARSAARRHEKALHELERALETKFDEQYRELEADNSRLRRDYKRMKRDWHLDKERAGDERAKLRAAAGRMHAEHAGLMKLLDAFSEPTERDLLKENKAAAAAAALAKSDRERS